MGRTQTTTIESGFEFDSYRNTVKARWKKKEGGAPGEKRTAGAFIPSLRDWLGSKVKVTNLKTSQVVGREVKGSIPGLVYIVVDTSWIDHRVLVERITEKQYKELVAIEEAEQQKEEKSKE